MPPPERKRQYDCDITYGTNNEFGFDYLRDNMAVSQEGVVLRGHHYAIVDEVDSVLIDEARTPLIIAGPSNVSDSSRFGRLNRPIENLVRKQRDEVSRIIQEAEEALKVGDEAKSAINLFIASKGAPKHRRLRKLLEEGHIQKLAQDGERDFLMKTSAQGGYNLSREQYFKEMFFFIDEKEHSITTTEKGDEALAKFMGVSVDDLNPPNLSDAVYEIEQDQVYTPQQKAKLRMEVEEKFSALSEQKHDISQLLRAHTLYEKDVEYVIQDGKVMIVDEFTGRLMYGRRYSDGLHSAIEAKEGVQIEPETQTIATITLQNYFRLYKKLAGMTGTAETEETEFWNIYKLEVVVVPTNDAVRRIDYDDVIYKTKREKYKAIIDEITDCHKRGQPVLVGTISVEVSETLSRMLQRQGIRHNVLNAKFHQKEAEVVAQAGQLGAVTIATNMAGRGTDIKLGAGTVIGKGAPGDKNKAEGGLHIIGTERHESRRIDRQLRGRSGRQGDPGSSRFYLSLEDDLMRLFGSEKIASVMDKMGVQEGEVIMHPIITSSISRAQKRVEMRNFDIRKHLLEYDDVMNQQREVIYKRRQALLFGDHPENEITEMIEDYADYITEEFTDDKTSNDEWDWGVIRDKLARTLLVGLGSEQEVLALSRDDLRHKIVESAKLNLEFKKREFGPQIADQLFRFAPLRIIDEKWKDHLYDMDRIKEGIGLRAYGQKDPLVEYKREGFAMFTEMLDSVNEEVLKLVFRAQLKMPPPERVSAPTRMSLVHSEATNLGFAGAGSAPGAQTRPADFPGRRPQGMIPPAGKPQPIKALPHVGRNEPCPCGSGKKYKQCHGRV
jgi:preprotein translocase subunit SecA